MFLQLLRYICLASVVSVQGQGENVDIVQLGLRSPTPEGALLGSPGDVHLSNRGDFVEDVEPQWTHIPDGELPKMYGSDTRLKGMEHCARFRDEVPDHLRYFGIAGLPNSGTNALFNLVKKNCDGPDLMWQVPWGKHNLMTHSHVVDHPSIALQSGRKAFAVVLVKDPIQWMSSTCRHSYFQCSFTNRDTCPSPVNKTHVKYFPPPGTPPDSESFDSIMHLWANWTLQYYGSDTPSLMIRFEDLLFKPEKLVTQVCDCMGGTIRGEFQVLETMAKWGGGHGIPHNRAQTLDEYTSKTAALMAELTSEDHAFMSAVLKETGGDRAAHAFHYDVSKPKDASLLGGSQRYSKELLSVDGWGEGDDFLGQ